MSTQPLHYELQATRSTRCEHHPVLWYLTLLFLQVLQGSLLSVWILTFSITWGLINPFWSMWNNNNHKALKTDAYDIVEAECFSLFTSLLNIIKSAQCYGNWAMHKMLWQAFHQSNSTSTSPFLFFWCEYEQVLDTFLFLGFKNIVLEE